MAIALYLTVANKEAGFVQVSRSSIGREDFEAKEAQE